eukprot:snap_masked-scaffold_12-processed-gene-2.21-mRNA-1 protein AED:1.00 eAED:1.00 QI:0/0/0/0/1/1/2/0/529
MTYLLSFVLLALFLRMAHSSAQVPDITGNFTFITTRYSNFIGDFDENCSITAPMVRLEQNENLCDLDSIEANISGHVLIIFSLLEYGCYEEIAYENAMELGAIALIDSVFIPPGSYHSVHNAKQSFKKGEYWRTYFEFFNEAEIKIEGCADRSRIIECFDTYQVILIAFSLIALFGVFLGYRAIKKLKWTPASRPRLALILYESIFLLLNAFILFFGLTFRQGKNLLDGRVISAQAKDIFGILQIVGAIHGSLMNAIYWNALRKGCFLVQSMTAEYWKKNFFLSPWQLVTLGLSIFYFFAVTTVVENYHQYDFKVFETYLRVVIWLDMFAGVILFISITHFLVALRKILVDSTDRETFSTTKTCRSHLHFVWNTIKGDSLKSTNLSGINEKLVILAIHLSKWLTFHGFIMVFSGSVVLNQLFMHYPFVMSQDDPKSCRIYSSYYAVICMRVFSSYCKIIGLRGPSKKKEIKVETAGDNLTGNPAEQQTTGNNKKKQYSKVHAAAYLNHAADDQNVENTRREGSEMDHSL